jgi:hypothetical protein
MEWSNRTFSNIIIVVLLWSYKLIITFVLFKVVKYFDTEVQEKDEDKLASEMIHPIKEEKLSARELLDQSFQRKKSNVHFKFYKASKSSRFFHLFFDNIMCVLIFSSVISMLMYVAEQKPEFENLRAFSKNDWSIYPLIFLWRILYYFTFETLFQTTPAKCLTSSKIISNDSNKLKPIHVVNRTWARFVPFEAFTFFGETGLHDKISDTSVVKEKNLGVNSAHYLWLIVPIVFLMIYLFVFKF